MTSYAAAACCGCNDGSGPCGLPFDFPTTFTFRSSFRVGMRFAHPPWNRPEFNTQFTYQVDVTSTWKFQERECLFRRTKLEGFHEYVLEGSPGNSPNYPNYSGDFVERRDILEETPQGVDLMFWGRASTSGRREIGFFDRYGNPQYDMDFAPSGPFNFVETRGSVPSGTPFLEVSMPVSSEWTPRASGFNGVFRGRGSNQNVKLFFPSSLALANGNTVPDLRDEPHKERFIQYPTEDNGSSGHMKPFACQYGAINGPGDPDFPWNTSAVLFTDDAPDVFQLPFALIYAKGIVCPKIEGFKRPGSPPFNSWSDLITVGDGDYYEYGVRMGIIDNITEESRVEFGFS